MNLLRLNDDNYYDSKRYLDIGRGQDSITVDKEYQKIMEHLKQAISVIAILNTAKKAKIENYLQEIYDECSSQNWDGYDAHPVSEETLKQAKKLLDALISERELELPIPDISADPDGDISFFWRKASRNTLVVSIGANGIISFAGIFGTSKINGMERFENELPDSIVYNLRRIY